MQPFEAVDHTAEEFQFHDQLVEFRASAHAVARAQEAVALEKEHSSSERPQEASAAAATVATATAARSRRVAPVVQQPRDRKNSGSRSPRRGIDGAPHNTVASDTATPSSALRQGEGNLREIANSADGVANARTTYASNFGDIMPQSEVAELVRLQQQMQRELVRDSRQSKQAKTSSAWGSGTS